MNGDHVMSGSSGSSGTSELSDIALKFLKLVNTTEYNILTCSGPIEAALIELKEDVNLYPSIYARREYRKVFERATDLLSILAENIGSKPTKSKLSKLERNLITFLNKAGKASDELRLMMTNEFSPLQPLSLIFDTRMSVEDLRIALVNAELFSRDMIVTWKPPHLFTLINKVFFLLLNKFEELEETLTNAALQFVLNLCDNNSACVGIVRTDEYYKDLWSLLTTYIRSGTPRKSEILIAHCHFSFEQYYTNRHSFCYKIVKTNIEKAFGFAATDPSFTVRLLIQIKNLIAVVFKTVKSICTNPNFNLSDQTFDAQNGNQTAIEKTQVAKTIAVTKKELCVFVLDVQNIILASLKSNPVLSTSNSTLNEIFNILAILPPSYLDLDDSLQSLKKNLEIMDFFIEKNSLDCELFMRYLRIVQQVTNFFDVAEIVKGSEARIEGFEPYFKRILNKMKLRQQNEDRNFFDLIPFYTSCLRFMSSIIMYYTTLAEDIIKKLEKSFLLEFTSFLGGQEFMNFDHQNMAISRCYVELLSLLSNFTGTTDILNILIKCVSSKEGLFHIAICILKGEVRDISKALKITTCVGFSRINLVALSKELSRMRDFVGYNSTMLQDDESSLLMSKVLTKKKRIQTFLKNIETREIEEKPTDQEILLTDIVNWYKIKQEISEEEIASLKQCVYMLTKTNNLLKKTVNRGAELMENKIAIYEQSEYDYLMLQCKLDKESKDSNKFAMQLQKELDAKMEMLEEEIKSKELLKTNIEGLEVNVKKLQKENTDLTHEKGELKSLVKNQKEELKLSQADIKKIKEELAASKKKIHQYEIDLKTKEEEKKQISLQLEKEKEMVDTIRGLLGNQYKV